MLEAFHQHSILLFPISWSREKQVISPKEEKPREIPTSFLQELVWRGKRMQKN